MRYLLVAAFGVACVGLLRWQRQRRSWSLWRFLLEGSDYAPRGSAWATRELFVKHCEDGTRLKFRTVEDDRVEADHRQLVKARKAASPLQFRRRA